ncbi:MAG: GNAT family N-acetyltransferase [Rhizobiaceae bacterium]
MDEVRSGAFSVFTPPEIDEFKKLVLSEGRVGRRTLPGLMISARCLVMLLHAGQVIGTAALKSPNNTYRKRVFRLSKVSEQESQFPYEMGWVVVHPDHRQRRYSHRLVEAALADIAAGVYATSQDRDTAMHRTLERSGFRKSGSPYPSTGNPGSKIFLFVR